LKLDPAANGFSRYSNLGNDDFGYTMLHQAIEMAEEMGIINHEKLKLNSSQMSEEMIRSLKRTSWGLFQVDTYISIATVFICESPANIETKQDCTYKLPQTEPRE
jgi:hypothetical protein